MAAPHLLADPAATPSPDPAGDWLPLSAALTAQIPAIAGRDDLVVACALGAGHGSPACYLPALARVEVDGTHLGVDPAIADPARPSDRERYPATWGALTHEAAHAAHSRWAAAIPATAAPAWAEAAILLEESRIEARQLRRRPGDRRWLRASATRFVLGDFPATPGAPPPTSWQAAHAAALLLARADAGVLDETETAPVAAAVTAVLGEDTLNALRAVWRDSHVTADTDTRGMLRLGRRWCRIIGTDPDTTRPPDTPAAGTGDPSPLAEAIAEVADEVTAADTPPPPVDPGRAAERAAENTARRHAATAARAVFEAGGTTRSVITGTRPPTAGEQAAARRLTRALRAAAARERTVTTLTSPTPPGRLRMRAALAADAQRAAGARPTAEPFTRVVRRHVPSPPLRVGIAVDISGSMAAFAGPAASAAWILARAASLIPGAQTATVTYGDAVAPVTRPGRAPAHVIEFTAPDSTEKFCKAIDALDGALGLSSAGAARLLVIISDGAYTADERTSGQRRLARLARAGCGILWLAPDTRWSDPMTGAHAVTITDPAATADTIARAATRALQAA
jgi:VWA domain containing CoxE-like protein